MTKRLRRLSFLFTMLGCAAAQAGEPRGEIIVSAMRAPTPLGEIGSSVSVIDAATLRERQYAFVADALRDAAGATLARNGGEGGAASVRLRGASSGQTLVVIDGVVVNDASAPQGGFNFGELDAHNIARIEVLRGPQSMLYGADAIGGVIVITSKKETGASAYVEGGARDTFRSGLSAGVANDDAYARLSFDGTTTSGISRASSGAEADGYKLAAAAFSAGAALSDHWRADVNLRSSRSKSEIDGFPPPLYAFADTGELEKAKTNLAAMRLTHDHGRFTGKGGVAWSNNDRFDRDGVVETYAAKGERLTVDYIGVFEATPALRFIGGGEWKRTSAVTSGVDANATASAGFFLAEVKPVDALTLSAGLRRDEFSNAVGATTTRAAFAWRIDYATTLRGSWGEGFRAPSLFELNYDQFGVMPNPDLLPERANGFDVGVDHIFAGGRISVTAFETRVTNQIDFDLDNYGYYNIAAARARGLEIEGGLALTQTADLALTYGYTDAIDRATGAQLPRQPRHKGTATLTVTPVARLTIGVSVIFNGRENDTPAGNDAFARLDLRAAFEIAEKLELFGRVENLTDAAYEDVSGYGEPGVSAYAGLRARL